MPGVCRMRGEGRICMSHIPAGTGRKLLRNPFYHIGVCVSGGVGGWLSNKVTDRSKDKVLNIWKPGPYHRLS